MQFQVPQFIENEQKIIGGVLTMRQFLTLSAGAGVLFGLFLYVNFYAWIILAVVISAGLLTISFLKINGRSINVLMRAAFLYYWNPSFYLWRAEDEYGAKELGSLAGGRATQTKPEEIADSDVITTFERPKSGSKIQIGGEIPRAMPKTRPSASAAELDPKETRARLKIGGQIQSLWEKISTSKGLVPKRESRLNIFQKERIEAGYQVMRRSTGEIEMAKRVDFK